MTAFTADTAAFRVAVCKVVRVIPERVPVPVLKGILISATGDGVELLATDYRTTHRATIPAEVKTPGRVLVDGALLARIARNLPADTVSVQLDRSTLTLTSGPACYRLLTMPEVDYPTDLPTDADMSKVRPAGADERERALTPPKGAAWRPTRARTLYEPTGTQPGAAITWTREVDGERVEVSGQVWASAPSPRSVWAIVEGEPRPSLVVERTYGEGSWRTGDYRKVARFEETQPHWIAFPQHERTAA